MPWVGVLRVLGCGLHCECLGSGCCLDGCLEGVEGEGGCRLIAFPAGDWFFGTVLLLTLVYTTLVLVYGIDKCG